MNETSFRIGCERAHIVVIKSIRGVLQMANPKNRDYITMTKTINVANESIPSMIIIKRINILIK